MSVGEVGLIQREITQVSDNEFSQDFVRTALTGCQVEGCVEDGKLVVRKTQILLKLYEKGEKARSARSWLENNYPDEYFRFPLELCQEVQAK